MNRFISVVLSVMAILLVAAPVFATKPDPDHKVGLCHRTASDSNPYVFIEVDEASLDAHLNNLPGHPAKEWKSDGEFRGVLHSTGDLKNDYLASDASECVDNTVEETPSPSATPTPTATPTPEQSTPTPTEEEPTPSPTPPVVCEQNCIPDTSTGSTSDLLWVLGIALISIASLMRRKFIV